MRKSIIVFLLAWAMTSYAQDEPKVQSLHKVYFLNPSYEFEAALSPTATFTVNPGLSFTLGARYSSASGTETLFSIYPSINAGFRHYYNLVKRQNNGKSIRGNSGNFLTAVFFLYGGELASSGVDTPDVTILPALAWGLQRTYNKNFNLSLMLGMGYYSARSGDRTWQGETPVAQVKIGYVFLKR